MSQREFAKRVVAQLRDAGHEALWAGGCVRDELLGRTPKDFDVATSALSDEVRAVFGKRRTLAIGASFGVITVLGPKEAGQIEVATFRTDVGYTDGRRPDGVTFTDAEHDASRRDFTINGLFFDPQRNVVVDYVGGRADLDAGIVRAIGDAERRFDEDKLRMLRAVRFAATLGFKLDATTADAIRKHAEELSVVSAERIGGETRRMLLDANRCRALRLLDEVGLLPRVFPELVGRLHEVDQRTGRLSDPSLGLALAALLPDAVDGPAAEAVARRLRFTRREGEHAAWLIDHATGIKTAVDKPWSVVQPILAHQHAADLISLHEASIGGIDRASSFCREKLSLRREVLDPPPLLVGRDLIEHGVSPCPAFGEWIAAVRAAQLDERITTRDEAIALVDRLRQ